MNGVLKRVLFVLLLGVFIVKILSVVVDFPTIFRERINAAMFLLIGLTYIFIGVDIKKSFKKGLFILSGLILILWPLVIGFKIEYSITVLLALLIPLILNSRLLRAVGNNTVSRHDKKH